MIFVVLISLLIVKQAKKWVVLTCFGWVNEEGIKLHKDLEIKERLYWVTIYPKVQLLIEARGKILLVLLSKFERDKWARKFKEKTP